MSEISRRQVIAASAAAAGALAATGIAAAEQAPKSAEKPAFPTHKFRLTDAPVQQYSGGTVQIVTSENFPASQYMSGALIKLKPGGVREPHWHPNCVEWDYVLSGRVKFNVVAPGGKAETFEGTTGDVVVFPQGYAHYFENAGPDEAVILITFNAGKFEEIGVSEWVAESPKESFAVSLDLPKGALDKAPDHGLFITSHKSPGK